MKYLTILFAEDGTYYEEHDSYVDAEQYVDNQCGDQKQEHLGGWIDDSGRQMYIEEM